MKKTLAILLVVTVLASFVACGGGGDNRPAGNQPPTSNYRVQVLEQMGDGSFALNGTKVGMVNGEKSIIFVGMGVAEDQQAAKETAQLNAQAAAASAIKTLATRQIARAWERVGIPGRTEQGEQVTRGLEAAVSRRVNVSGLTVTRNYYRYVKKPGYARPFYEWYSEMAMSYTRYKELRDGIVSRNAQQYRLNPRQRVLYNQTERALRELNRMDGESNGGIPGGQVQLDASQRQQRTQAVPQAR